MKRTRTREAGFTLVELMIVVVIIGILAATAIPSFQKFIYRTRASEAPTMIGSIRLRQEAYRAEFGQYLGNATASAYYPTGAPTPSMRNWDTAAAANPFRMLGVNPGSGVYFQYNLAAGYDSAPSAQYPGGYDDWWWVVQAQSDLDGDGILSLVEGIAGRTAVWRREPYE